MASPPRQSSLWLHRRHQHDDHSRRSGTIYARSPAALRTMAVCSAGRSGELLRARARELGLNGSFAVFKMIETDVVGFENFLQSNKDKIDPELLAAKICGRWRNGTPLELSPETDSPPGGISTDS